MDLLKSHKITVDNGEFTQWRTRIEASQKLGKELKESNQAIQDAFDALAKDMQAYVDALASAYVPDGENDEMKAFIDHTSKEVHEIVSSMELARAENKLATEYLAELDAVTKEYQKVQKVWDSYQDVIKAKEKEAASKKVDSTKLAGLTGTIEARKGEYERVLDEVLRQMKAVDAKRPAVMKTVLGVHGMLLKNRSSTIRKHLQHALNFSTTSIKEMVDYDLTNAADDNVLKTPIPDLHKAAAVMQTKEGSTTWQKNDNVWWVDTRAGLASPKGPVAKNTSSM
mmetsp:Transcript_18539/g.32179  ORF Transcript_18539/g.32179 Transcript_18539/m.32179 type:complete len:283 (-) Transcript_18539:226-1074(-)